MTSGKDLRITVVLGILLLLLFAVIPEGWIFNERIICPTRLIFHIPCPLCGMTRAAWLLVHLRWGEAWMQNPGIFPLAVLFCLMILAASLPLIAKRRQEREAQWKKILRWSVWGCIGLILVFYLFRL